MVEVPLENDNSLLLSSLHIFFPRCTGLKYSDVAIRNKNKSQETGMLRIVGPRDNKLYAPQEGWENHSFIACCPKRSLHQPAVMFEDDRRMGSGIFFSSPLHSTSFTTQGASGNHHRYSCSMKLVSSCSRNENMQGTAFGVPPQSSSYFPKFPYLATVSPRYEFVSGKREMKGKREGAADWFSGINSYGKKEARAERKAQNHGDLYFENPVNHFVGQGFTGSGSDQEQRVQQVVDTLSAMVKSHQPEWMRPPHFFRNWDKMVQSLGEKGIVIVKEFLYLAWRRQMADFLVTKESVKGLGKVHKANKHPSTIEQKKISQEKKVKELEVKLQQKFLNKASELAHKLLSRSPDGYIPPPPRSLIGKNFSQILNIAGIKNPLKGKRPLEKQAVLSPRTVPSNRCRVCNLECRFLRNEYEYCENPLCVQYLQGLLEKAGFHVLREQLEILKFKHLIGKRISATEEKFEQKLKICAHKGKAKTKHVKKIFRLTINNFNKDIEKFVSRKKAEFLSRTGAPLPPLPIQLEGHDWSEVFDIGRSLVKPTSSAEAEAGDGECLGEAEEEEEDFSDSELTGVIIDVPIPEGGEETSVESTVQQGNE